MRQESIGEHLIDRGIILPESQNHLLYDISESMFGDAADPCEYQYGLTGTFALMVALQLGFHLFGTLNQEKAE